VIKNFLKNLIAVLTFFNGALAMSLDDIGKVCLFSKISGIITLNGQLVSNAKLTQGIINCENDDKNNFINAANFKFK